MDKALQFSRELQTHPKTAPEDKGGWRYLRVTYGGADSDLSVTGWHLMFLRSARNAEFNVPQKYIDDAMSFVHRCWVEEDGLFHYTAQGDQQFMFTRGLMGSAIVSLALAGQHQSPEALAAGDWLLAHPFQYFGERIGTGNDRFFYSTYYCSQAAAQLGGRYWTAFFRRLPESWCRPNRATVPFRWTLPLAGEDEGEEGAGGAKAWTARFTSPRWRCSPSLRPTSFFRSISVNMGDGQHRVARGGAGFFFALLIFCAAAPATAEGGAQPVPPPSAEPPPLAAVLPKARWQQVESSVDHALAWLASQQAADGSFPSAPAGQPRGDEPVRHGVSSARTSARLRSLWRAH